MRDLVSNISVVELLPPRLYSTDFTSQAIDTASFGSCVFSIQIGVGGIVFDSSSNIVVYILHSDDDTHYEHVDINWPIAHISSNHPNAEVVKIGYAGSKRFLKRLVAFNARLVSTNGILEVLSGGNHSTGTALSAVAILGDANKRPVAR